MVFNLFIWVLLINFIFYSSPPHSSLIGGETLKVPPFVAHLHINSFPAPKILALDPTPQIPSRFLLPNRPSISLICVCSELTIINLRDGKDHRELRVEIAAGRRSVREGVQGGPLGFETGGGNQGSPGRKVQRDP